MLPGQFSDNLFGAGLSIGGYYLRWLRYGGQFQRMLEDCLERDGWSAAQVRAWQEEEVARLLHRAVRQVPWYREHWSKRRRRGDKSSQELIGNWPILDKEEVRRHGRAFIADDCSPRWMTKFRTSGSTGTPLTIWKSRRTLQKLYAGVEARWRLPYGISRKENWAIVGSRLVVDQSRTTPPFWIWNRGLHQLYMSHLHISPPNISHFVSEILRRDIRYMWGFPSALDALAAGIKVQGLAAPKLAAVVTCGEPLFEHHRTSISEVFGCRVFQTYGMVEDALCAAECQQLNLHLWPEAGYLEIVKDGAPAPAGCAGELIATGLINTDMPLIRYRTRDRGQQAAGAASCACGRCASQVAAIEGRLEDLLWSTDGDLVPVMNVVFRNLPIRRGRIVQQEVARIVADIEPAWGWGIEHEIQLIKNLQARLGAVAVEIRKVDRIAPGRGGKFRVVERAIGEVS